MAEQVKQKKPKKVLLAMDGSKHSDYAFEWYMENAHEKDDEVFMGFCAEFHHHHSTSDASTGSNDSGNIREAMSKGEEKAQQTVQALEDLAKRHNVKCTVLELNGKPGEAIVHASKEKEVDMVVVGSRGHGKLRRTIMGSCSDYVVHHAHVPVIVCKHEDEHHKLK